MSELLDARGLHKSYCTAAGELPVLRDFGLQIGSGELLGILGPSGCGKSTLLRLLASLEAFDRGSLLYRGHRAALPGRERMLLLPDENQLFPWLTAAGNVAFALRASGRPCSRQDARRLLERVHLGQAAEAYPHTLSSGMRQRVALARALAADPQVLLMDEPFARLDAQTRTLLQDLVLELWGQGRLTIVFVTHDILEVLRLAERVVVMGRDGSIRLDEPNALAHPRDLSNPALYGSYARLQSLLEVPRPPAAPGAAAGRPRTTARQSGSTR